MITSRKQLGAIAVTLAVIASPSFAQKSEPQMSAARAAAIHECNARAAKYSLSIWGNVELYVYRACMAEHHQME